MKWLQPLGPVAVALAVAWILGGAGSCADQASPQLVQVLDVAPREVELGDSIAVVGAGFPSGKTARVTFRGTLHRPGERPVTGAEVVAAGSVVGPERVEVSFGEANEALFCGAGDRAMHTTFDGDVEVAFAAALQGASPIAGVLSGVTLDVRPTASGSDFEQEREGERVARWLGLHVSTVTRGVSGLAVEGVDPRSRAEASGIAPGDVIVRFDGVRVASLGDLLPSPDGREAAVALRRPESSGEVERKVAVEGFRRTPPADLLGATLAILAALAAILLFGSPVGPLAAAIHRAGCLVASRASLEHGARGSVAAGLKGALSAAAREAFPAVGAPVLVDVAAGALLAVMPFGQYLVASQLDVGILFVAATAALVAAAVAAGGSVWHAVRAAVHVTCQHLPGAVAVATVVVTTGSLRVQEIERAQGGAPWDWLAFRSPCGLVALLLLVACGLIELDEGNLPTGIDALVDVGEAHLRRARGVWLAAAYRAHRLVIAGLACTLFLGGWRLPGMSPAEQDGRPALELAGAAWLLAKTWGVVLVLAWVRWATPRRFQAERTRAVALGLAPLSLGCLAGAAAWTWWSPTRATQVLVSGSLVALAALAAAALGGGILRALGRPDDLRGDGQLSAFL
jgi:NADH-quinone oxidoreductase subunit H